MKVSENKVPGVCKKFPKRFRNKVSLIRAQLYFAKQVSETIKNFGLSRPGGLFSETFLVHAGHYRKSSLTL